MYAGRCGSGTSSVLMHSWLHIARPTTIRSVLYFHSLLLVPWHCLKIDLFSGQDDRIREELYRRIVVIQKVVCATSEQLVTIWHEGNI